MIKRSDAMRRIQTALARSPVTALMGPRQCGKTTLARMLMAGEDGPTSYFDLESEPDRLRMTNPEAVLSAAQGLVVLDEIQALPPLFPALRVVVDRIPPGQARFLILGSASPMLAREAGQTLAGRVEFVDITGFTLADVGPGEADSLWVRGGFPRSFLAASDADAAAWREGFARTFLERDLGALGVGVNPVAMRRFWTMLAHVHGQTWNGSELARSLGATDKTVRGYLDILTHAFMVRQLQPWHENLAKRQVKAPKVYFRDPGLLHTFLAVSDLHGLLGHPKCGASWEGFALEQVLSRARPFDPAFWATHGGAELDLFYLKDGARIGVEFKRSEAPRPTRSMRVAIEDLRLDRLWIVAPVREPIALDERITAIGLDHLDLLAPA